MSRSLLKKLGVLLVLSLVVAVCCGAVAAADWNYLGNDGRTSSTTEAGPQTDYELWKTSLASVGVTDGYHQSATIDDGKIYVSVYTYQKGKPSVFCYDQSSGKQLWNATLTGTGGARGGVTLTEDSIYVLGNDNNNGKLFRLDKDGKVLNSTDNLGKYDWVGLSSTPIVLGDTVWINAVTADTKDGSGNYLYGFDLGLTESSKKVIDLSNQTGGIFTTVSTNGTHLFVPADGGIRIYDADGTLVNEADLGLSVLDGYEVSTPVFYDGNIYLYAYNKKNVAESKLYSLDVTGNVITENWEEPVNITATSGSLAQKRTSPAVSDSLIVVTTQDGIAAYDRATGKFEWENEESVKNTVSFATPLIAGDTVYYGYYKNGGTKAAGIQAVKAIDGTPIWKNAITKNLPIIEGSYAVVDGYLYYGDNKYFYALGSPTEPDFNRGVSLGSDEVYVQLVNDAGTKTPTLVAGNSGIAALDAASRAQGFTYNVSTDGWLRDIDGIASTWDPVTYETTDWAIYLNGEVADSFITGVDLKEGDRLTLYYCEWNVDPVTYEMTPLLDTATEIINIEIDMVDVMYDDVVSLTNELVSIELNDKVTVKSVDGLCILAALDAVSKDTGFDYKISYAEPKYAIESIGDLKNNKDYKWVVYKDGSKVDNLNEATLVDGDKLKFYYCKGDDTTATHVLVIEVDAPVSVSGDAIFNGQVQLTEGTIIVEKDADTSLKVDKKTVLGVLDAASAVGGFTYKAVYVTDGFVLKEINGVESAWKFTIDGKVPESGTIDTITVNKDDQILFSNTTHYILIRATEEPTGFTLTLKQGWNFISVPKTLASGQNTVEKVFAGVDTTNGKEKASILRYNDETQEWETVTKGDEILALEAYWIYSNKNNAKVTLTYTADQQSIPVANVLNNGWNAVGISSNEAITVDEFLGGVTNWEKIKIWNAGSFTEIKKADTGNSEILTPGTGNWVFINPGNMIA